MIRVRRSRLWAVAALSFLVFSPSSFSFDFGRMASFSFGGERKKRRRNDYICLAYESSRVEESELGVDLEDFLLV